MQHIYGKKLIKQCEIIRETLQNFPFYLIDYEKVIFYSLSCARRKRVIYTFLKINDSFLPILSYVLIILFFRSIKFNYFRI